MHENNSSNNGSTNGTTTADSTSSTLQMTKEPSKFLALARKCNNFYLKNGPGSCTPFIIDGFQVGLIQSSILEELVKIPHVFHMYREIVELNPTLNDYDSRTRALEAVLKEWRKNELFVTLKGWRDECFEVKCSYDTPSLLKMERSATCLFGFRQYGVTINGYVNHPTRGLCLWFQKRSLTKQTWPGMYDNMVGGGLSVGFNVLETALKEAQEEASVPEILLQGLKPGGCVSFFFNSERGLFPNTEFIFDLELPHGFTPSNADGEVESFHLFTIEECKNMILSPQFKTTSCPVVLDFLVRHSVINSQNEPNLNEILHLIDLPLEKYFKKLPSVTNGN